MSSASVPFADRPDCTRRNKANRPCTRPEAPWPDGAPLPDPHSCGLHFTDEERAALGRPAAVRAGAATSFYLTAPLMERRRAVKEATGCPDAYLYEHGLHSVEVELERALKDVQSGCEDVCSLIGENDLQRAHLTLHQIRDDIDALLAQGDK